MAGQRLHILCLWIIGLLSIDTRVLAIRHTIGVPRESSLDQIATWPGETPKQPTKRATSSSRSVKTQAQEKEYSALLAFKQTLSSSDAVKLASWQSGTDHCDGSWTGIQCFRKKSRQVYLIDLSGLGLQFSLSSLDLSAFPGLQVLWLNENFVRGSLQDTFAPAGPAGALKSLVELRLHDAGLTGPLPSTLPPRLRKLHLQNNQLNGSLPAEWSTAAPNLEVLLLATNSLTGAIPDTWERLTKLNSLSLENNANLTGCLPAWAKAVLMMPSSSSPSSTGSTAARAGISNTQLCGLCGSQSCTTSSNTSAAAAAAAGGSAALLPAAAVAPQPQVQPVVAVSSAVSPAARAPAASPSVGPAAADMANATQGTAVPPVVIAPAAAAAAAVAPAAPAVPGAAAAAAAAAVPAAALGAVVPPAAPVAPVPAAGGIVQAPPAAATSPAASASAAAAVGVTAPASPSPALSTPPVPAMGPAPIPSPTPTAAVVTPAGQAAAAPAPVPAPAIVAAPGTAVGAPVVASPPVVQPAAAAAAPTGAPAAPASQAGPAPVDPGLTVIDGKNRKPTYI